MDSALRLSRLAAPGKRGGGRMLEIRKTAIGLSESDLIELERIIVDSDEKEALRFLKRSVYDRIIHSQQGRLKSHLDSASPVEGFIQQTAQHDSKE